MSASCRRPVSREVFLREFWKCFKRLEDQADEMVGKAAYFRFLTLLGAHVGNDVFQYSVFG